MCKVGLLLRVMGNTRLRKQVMPSNNLLRTMLVMDTKVELPILLIIVVGRVMVHLKVDSLVMFSRLR